MKFLPVLIIFLACYKKCQPTKTGTYLTPNVLLLEVKENESVNINLSCGNHSGDDISWRHNGNLLSSHGNPLHAEVKYLKGGNYSCHRDGSLLHHILVLQSGKGYRNSILVKPTRSEPVTCSARNFDGKFQCSWQKTKERKDAELFHFAAIRGSNGSDNIKCTMGENGNTLNCEDNAHCPYAEEPGRINLWLYFRSYHRYEEYHRTFFISEIVKPDNLTITKVQDNSFTWAYPDTWSVPSCYFQLMFEVKIVNGHHSCEHGNGKMIKEMSFAPNITNRHSKRGYKVCVRAQEESSKSIWSDWSVYAEGPKK